MPTYWYQLLFSFFLTVWWISKFPDRYKDLLTFSWPFKIFTFSWLFPDLWEPWHMLQGTGLALVHIMASLLLIPSPCQNQWQQTVNRTLIYANIGEIEIKIWHKKACMEMQSPKQKPSHWDHNVLKDSIHSTHKQLEICGCLLIYIWYKTATPLWPHPSHTATMLYGGALLVVCCWYDATNHI